jgi:porin
MKRFMGWRQALLAGPILLWAAAAVAQSTAPDKAEPAPTGLWERSTLLGDVAGLRTLLGKCGIALSIADTETLLGNVSGGVRQGATMQGVTTATMQVDTSKAFELPGGTINISALQIHGNNDFSAAYLDDLQTANGNEAENSTRLWELWYDQAFANGTYDIKIGQQSIDQEFIASRYSGLFVNTMAGWPTVPSADLYGGGPAYPLSSLGVRLRAEPASNVTLLAGVFDDNPGGGAFGDDAQALNASGTRFNLNTGALFIAEAQVATNFVAGLPGTYKLGFWYDTARFPDEAFDNHALSLANPASDGVPLKHSGNFGIYGVIDQTLWQPKGGARSLNAFLRVMGAPSDRNLISFSANGGLTLADPLPGREHDTVGIDVGVAQVSERAADLDRATGFYTGAYTPVRGTETLIELTYQAQVTPWLQVQPDLQFVFNPGGGVANPDAPSKRLSNAVVVGVRTTAQF